MTVWAVDNIASLRAATAATVPTSQVSLAGWDKPADRGGGIFYCVMDDTVSADNGGTVIIDTDGRRWHRDKPTGHVNMLWFSGNRVTDYAPALQAMLAVVQAMAASGHSAHIEMPAGVYKCFSPITFTYPVNVGFRLGFYGAGADSTILEFQDSDGFAFDMTIPEHTLHMQGMTLATTASGTRSAVTCNQAKPQGLFGQNEFIRVTFRGADWYTLSQSWGNEIVLNGLGNVNFDGILCYGSGITQKVSAGTGIILNGAMGAYGLVYNFNNCSFWELANGVIYGDHIQGVTVRGCNFTNVVNGIFNPAGAAGGAQLAVSNTQFGCLANGIICAGALTNVQLSNNLFLLVNPNSSGAAFLGTGAEYTMTGNVFGGMNGVSGGTAINFAAGTYQIGTIIGNTFADLALGVNLSAATDFTVNDNAWSNVNTKVLDPTGTNKVGVTTE